MRGHHAVGQCTTLKLELWSSSLSIRYASLAMLLRIDAL